MKTCKDCKHLVYRSWIGHSCSLVQESVTVGRRPALCPKKNAENPKAVADLKELIKLFRKLGLEFYVDRDGGCQVSTKYGFICH